MGRSIVKKGMTGGLITGRVNGRSIVKKGMTGGLITGRVNGEVDSVSCCPECSQLTSCIVQTAVS